MASRLILSLKKQKSFYGSKIKLVSPAKINLYLNILGRYTGGYHRLESVVERISLCDDITIEVKKEPSVKIFSNCKNLETNQNLCFKAVQLLRRKFKFHFGFNLFLKKNIPIGSGLGGGSSNAASTLLGISKLLNLNLEKNQLYQLGAELGSDVNFFLSDCRFALLRGRGEEVTPLANIDSKFSHCIIWPGIHISTKKVYKNIGVKLTKFFNNVNMLKYALRKGDIFLIKKNLFNALENNAFTVSKQLKKAKLYLNERGLFPLLTGSGSALYTVSKNTSVRKLKSLTPNGWAVFKVQTF